MLEKREYSLNLRGSIALMLVFAMMYMLIFGGIDLKLFKFGKEQVEHIAVIEEGDGYTIYKNSDGSNTLELALTNPEVESLVAIENGVYDYKSLDSSADIYLNSDLKSGEPSILIERANFKIEMLPIISATSLSESSIYDENTGTYEKVYSLDAFGEGIDLEYTPISGGMKENIVLNAPTDILEFSYILNVENLYAELIANNVQLKDVSGEIKYVISAPYMVDKQGAESGNVRIELEKITEAQYKITIIPNKEWINDDAREYPIVIDPTITSSGTSRVNDTYVSSESGERALNFHTADRMYVGLDYSNDVYRSYIDFNMPSTIPSHIIVTNADVRVSRTNTQSAWCYAALYEPSSTWNESTITWNNQPGVSSKYSSGNTLITSSGTYTFDATAYAMDIFPNGEYVGDAANKGVVLRAASESTNSGYLQKNMNTSESGTVRLTITYNVPISMPAPTATAYGNGANSKDGYVELSWDAVAGATGYYVGVFNGDEYQMVDVNNVTSWSTQNQNLWATETQTGAGEYELRVDNFGNSLGDGDEFYIFPNMAYRNAPDGTVDYDDDTNYYFIIIPHNSSGYMTYPAYCDKAEVKLPDVIEPSTPSTLTIAPASWSTISSHTLEWSGVQDYNGTEFITTNIGSIEYTIESGTVTTVSGAAVWNATGETDGDSSYTIDTTPLADGTYTVFHRTVDTAGNVSDSAYENIHIDRTNPTIGAGGFASNADSWTNTDTVVFTYDAITDAASGIDTAEIFKGVSYVGDVDTAQTTYNMDVTATTYDESVYTLKVVDNAGNEMTVDAYVRIDKLAPQVSLSSPADASQVNGIVEIWGTCTDGIYTSMDSYLLEVIRYDGNGTYKETITLENGANSYYNNELINVVDTNAFDQDDILEIHLTATDKVGYTTEDTVTVTVDKSVVLLDDTLEITAPASGGIADDEFEQIVYIRDAAAAGTLDTINFFVDGSLFSKIPVGDVFFDTLRYLEQTQHSVALIGENSLGVFEYSQGIAERIALSSSILQSDMSEHINISFVSDGIELTDPAQTGYVIFNPITLNANDLTYLVNASATTPTGTSVVIEISLDNEATWTNIDNNKDYILDSDSSGILVKLTLTGDGTNSPTVLGTQVKCANIQNPYYITVQTVEPVEGLRIISNTLRRVSVGWIGSFDSDVRYDVYRGTTSNFAVSPENRIITQFDGVTIVDTNVSSGTTYYYKVIATKTYLVTPPRYPFRESEERTISVTAYKTPVYTDDTPDDETESWGNEDEISDSSNVNDLYGGNWTVDNQLPPPEGAHEMNESMLGARTFCAAGFEPINFVSGNFFMKQLDSMYSAMPDVNSSILRTYNTQADEDNGPLGNGWSWYYSMHLKLYSTGDVGMVQPDGHLAMFRIQLDGTYKPDDDELMTLTKTTEEYIVESLDGEQTVFDSGGQLKRIVSENGNTSEVKYDSRGVIDRVEYSSGEILNITTDENGHIIIITMPNGENVYYNYEGNNLVKYYDTAGNAIRYIYDEQGCMIEWYDKENNRQVHNVYDDEDRVTAQWDANGYYYQLEYKEDSVVTTDGEGYNKEYFFDEMGRTTEIVDSFGYSLSYEYNENSQVTKYTDKLGMTTEYRYDDSGNLIKEITNDNRMRYYTYDASNNLAGETDYLGNWTVYEYDNNNNLTKRTYPDGSYYTYEYNADNQLISITNALGYTELYEYDGENMVAHTDADGNKTTYEYNDIDQLINITDSNGNITKMEYNDSGNITKTILPDNTSMSYQYDAMDNMISFADAKGQVTSFEYDGLGHMIRTINPDGTEISYEYDGSGNMVKTIYPDQSYIVNTYDSNNDLVSTADQDGRTYHMEYNPAGDILRVIEPNSNESALSYSSANGWLSATMDGNGAETEFEYDDNGNVTKLIYNDGTTTEYTYDVMGRVSLQTLNNGATLQYNYNTLGQLESVIDPMGNATWYIYDKIGQLQEVIDSLGNRTNFEYDAIGNMVGMVDARGESIAYSYDAASQLTQIIAPLGGELSYSYDPNGQLQKVINALGASANNVYDEMGRVVESTDLLGATSTYEYDVVGNLVKETNALGNSFNYEYDANGNITKITDALENEANFEYDVMSNITHIEGEEGYEESYEYDNLGRIVKTIDSEGYEKYYEYDEMDRLEKEWDNTEKSLEYTYTTIGQVRTITNAEGETTTLYYDLNGNTTKVKYADNSTETYYYNELNQLIRQYDRVGLETKYEYDAVGNVIKVTQPSQKVYTYEYDANGNMVSVTNPEGGETTYQYDDAGNATHITDPMGNTTEIEYNNASMIERVIDAQGTTTLTVDYSILGEVVAETDANGNTTNYGYDALSRLVSVIDPLSRTTNYQYDGADNITQVIDANGNMVEYEYNTVGLLTKETDALGNVEQYTYYVDGLLEEIAKADGTTSIYEYDLAGRMTNVDYSDGTAIDYGYNEVGSTTTMTDKIGTTTYQYDDMQRLVSTTDSNDKTVGYTYDILGRRTSIILPDGQTTNYEYDILDRLTTVYDGSEVLIEYEYNANSQLISNSRNDITTVYEYNELGQITQLTTSDISEQIQQFSYQYDDLGNIVEEVRTESETTNTRAYEYDGANQLTEFTDNDYTEAYTYDSVGNMLNKDVNGALTSYEFNEANQLTAKTLEQDTIEYIYNQNGDLVEKSSGEKYTYDIQGNLTSIIGNDINQSFTYNGNGNRLSKTVDDETTYYVNDLNQRYEQVIQTYNDEGIIDTYTYGLQRIDSKGQTNEIYLYDGRGSVVGAVGTDNNFVSYSYTAYGELMSSSLTPTVFGYNAEATDFDTGMQYLRARYYDTTVQRFVQEDDYKGKYTRPSSMNRYAYTHNNPVMGIDPSGYKTDGFHIVVNGTKYYSYNDLKQATSNAKYNFDLYNGNYMYLYARVYGSNGDAGSKSKYLSAFYEYKDAWDKAWFKTSKKVSNLHAVQNNKYLAYKSDYKALQKAEEDKLPYWNTYISLQSALDNWKTKKEEHYQKLFEEELKELKDEIGYEHIEDTTATGIIDNDIKDKSDNEYITTNYPIYVTDGNGLCNEITQWNTSSSGEAIEIWNRLSWSEYPKGSYAREMLYQVLFSEAVGQMSTDEIMTQFALQFTGNDNDLGGNDKINFGSNEYKLPYNQTGGYGWDDQNDCSGVVNELYYLFHGEQLRTDGHVETQVAHFQFKQQEEIGNAIRVEAGTTVIDIQNELQTGDLVYFDNSSGWKEADHVAMVYIGEDGEVYLVQEHGTNNDMYVEKLSEREDNNLLGYLTGIGD